MNIMTKFPQLQNVPDSEWTDWKWQNQHRFNNHSNIAEFFPQMSPDMQADFQAYITHYHFAMTPYVLSLIELDHDGNPVEADPIWNQFRFYNNIEMSGAFDYDKVHENWEISHEMPTPILHHKYPDRVLFRLVNTCFGHCTYCYRTSRVIDRSTSSAKRNNPAVWEASLRYLRSHPHVRDVLLSGGDPLILDNEQLEHIMSDLAHISSVTSLRLNTRVLTFNPYRIDKDLILLFKKYRLTALEIHVAHPREITEVFIKKLALFDEVGYRPLILQRTPLLRDINDSEEVLEELYVRLYQLRVTPYYLFHYAPYTLGRARHGVSIKRGCVLLSRLRRIIPGPAFPKYTLFHIEGKRDIPLEPEGSATFVYASDEQNRPIVRFRNWKGHWVTYPDIEE